MLPYAYVLHLYHPRASLDEPTTKPAYFRVRAWLWQPCNHLRPQLKDVYDLNVRPSILNKTYVAVAVEHQQLVQRSE